MNAKVIALIGLIFIFTGQSVAMGLFTTSDEAPLTWSIETVDSAGDVGVYTSIALGSGDNPHISYYDYMNDDLKYARWMGPDWSIETVDSAGDVGEYTSLALDSGDNPHISYRDETNSNLKYARWTGSDWSIETVDLDGDVGRHTSIALDSGDNPHISYLDDTNGYLKYARWTGSAWSNETVDSDGVVGWSTSLTLDSGDKPHISYRDYLNGDLKYAWWTGSAWSIETVDSDGNVGSFSSLALDSGDDPHISYFDYTNGDLKYARWTGSDWSIETVDSAGVVGWTTSLALDSGDDPHISYWDYANDDLKYAQWTGSAWNIETVDSAGDVGKLPSIALDSGDDPHISYFDGTNLDLKYARGLPSFLYHFRLSPSSSVVHINVDSSGWINGYMTGGVTGWNPVLGKVDGDKFYMAIDLQPDGTPGPYELAFLVGTISTLKAQVVLTLDGMSYIGPIDVGIVPTAGSEEVYGVDILEVSSSGVPDGAWYTLRLNPYTDIIRLNVNPDGWLNGYDEPDHPVLGFYEGNSWYFAIDSLDTTWTLVFNTGSISTLQGDMIRTTDGKTYDGPHDIWLTEASSQVEFGEGESTLQP